MFLLTKLWLAKTQTMLNRYPLLSSRKYLETVITMKNLMGIPRSDELPPLPEPQQQQSSEDESSESQMYKFMKTEVE